MIDFRRIHVIETLSSSGGGIPKVIKNIKRTCEDDCIVAVNELSFRETLKIISGLKDKTVVIFLHNIYSLKAVLHSLFAKLITRGILIVSTHGATNTNLIIHSTKKKTYLKLITPVLSVLTNKFHFLNEGEQLNSYISNKVNRKVVIFPYPIWAPKISLDYKMGNDNYISLMFYSRVERRKGILNLVTAVNQLNSSGLNVDLNIYGPLVDDEIVEAINKSSHTLYHGEIDIEIYSRSLNANSVFCLPSYGEANSLALLEHVIMGIPCIVSKEANSPVSDGIKIYGSHSDISALKYSILELSSLNSRHTASNGNLEFVKNNLDMINKSFDYYCELIIIESKRHDIRNI